jgi:glutaredoxin
VSAHHITFYTKPGCHLCEDALRMLHELRPEFDLTIEEIDISGERELFKKYFDKIPVLQIDQRVTLAAPIHIDAVRAALR